MPENKYQKSPLAVELDAGTHYACTCGRSGIFPQCDLKTHKGMGIIPRKFELEKKQTVYLCRCGNSGKHPFCDGTHQKA